AKILYLGSGQCANEGVVERPARGPESVVAILAVRVLVHHPEPGWARGPLHPRAGFRLRVPLAVGADGAHGGEEVFGSGTHVLTAGAVVRVQHFAVFDQALQVGTREAFR